MSDKAILIASFGTSYDNTREKTIGAVERRIEARFPDFICRRAYTSGMVRKVLEKRGIHIPGVTEALEELANEGVKTVLIQPTHLIYGEEYEKILAEAGAFEDRFQRISFGAPLLADYADIHAVLETLDAGIPRQEGEALVLMGHGANHFCNTVYAAMDYYAAAEGFESVVVGTVEAYPDLEAVSAALKRRGLKKAVLTPLMLVAGDHAQNDMAGDEDDSWANILRAQGLTVRTVLRGLGEYEALQERYCSHAEKAL